ncbi:hypothetical protein L810_0136 [Burkholderia sp. AU4i]|nr:hypothetical protein L810_0136 [Burkholderia sp. AU4i]
MVGDAGQHAVDRVGHVARQPAARAAQVERIQCDAQVAEAFDRRMTVVVGRAEARQQLRDAVEHPRRVIALVVERLRRRGAHDVFPARAQQAPHRELGAERPRRTRPHIREQKPGDAREVAVQEHEEIGVVRTLDADEGGRVHGDEHRHHVELRARQQRADQDERPREHHDEHREIVYVRQHDEQVQAREHDARGRREEELEHQRRRLVERGEEAARHGHERDGRGAVVPPGRDPQPAREHDRGGDGQRREQHHPAIEEALGAAEPPVPVARLPDARFVADQRAQRAAVLPDVDDLAQPPQRVRQQRAVPARERVVGRLQRGNAFAQALRDRVVGHVAVVAGLDGRQRCVEPFRGIGKQVVQPGRPDMQVAHQRNQRIGERRHQRQEQLHPARERLRTREDARMRMVVAQLAQQEFEARDGCRESLPARGQRLAGNVPGQRLAAVERGVLEPCIGTLDQRRREPVREDGATDHARADDAEHDLLGTRDRDVEHGGRIGHGRQRDQRHRIAGEHEHVAARGAVGDREVEQRAAPGGDDDREQQRRLDERRHEEDRGRRAERGAERAIQRLRACRADERVRHDVDARHRPVRARQLEIQAEVQRQHRRGERLAREQPVAKARIGHDVALPVRDARAAGVGDSDALNASSTRSVASRSARVTPLSTCARSTRRSSSIFAVTARPAAVSEIVFARRSCGSSSRRARPAAHSWSSRRTSDGPSMPTCSASVPCRTPSPRRPAISSGVAQASDTLYAFSTPSLVRRHLRADSTSRLLTTRRRSCRLVMGEMIGAK